MIPAWAATAIEVVLALAGVALIYAYDFESAGSVIGICCIVIAVSVGYSVRDET